MRIEYIVVTELFFNIGRVVSILAFILLVTFFDDKQSIRILLAVIGAGHLAIYFCVRKVTLRRPDPDGDEDTSMSANELMDGEGGSPV